MKHHLILMTLAMLLGLTSLAGQTAGHEDATPAAGATVDADSLAGMLGLLPALPIGGNAAAMVTYANVAAQLAAVGASAAWDLSDETAAREWSLATSSLALPRDVAGMFQPAWGEALGFDGTLIDQAIEYAAPPAGMTILRGRFDPIELRAAWQRGGYQVAAVEGGIIFSIRDDYEIDFDDPVSRLALASFNHVALIDDETLAYSIVRDNLRRALAVTAGNEASFADHVAVAPLLTNAPPDLVSAMLIPGSSLMSRVDPAEVVLQQTPGADALEAIATRFAAQSPKSRQLPSIAAALFGQTAGSPPPGFSGDSTVTAGSVSIPEARLVIVLTMMHRDAAVTAVPLIEERLATGGLGTIDRTYDELFPERRVRVADEGSVVLIELSLGAESAPNILMQMFFRRDLNFLAWGF